MPSISSYRQEQSGSWTRIILAEGEQCVNGRDYEYASYSFDLLDCFYQCFEFLTLILPQPSLLQPSTKKNLPHDIITDILSRLPAHSLLGLQHIFTASLSTSFITTHCNRAAPVIAFCYHFTQLGKGLNMRLHYVNFTDATGKNTTTSLVSFRQFPDWRKALFYGSCHGFLLFVSEYKYVHIWNPITKQKIRVGSGVRRFFNSDGLLFCGFYFHTVTKSHRLLFQHFHKEKVPQSFSLYVFDLLAFSARLVANNIYLPPTIGKLPTMVNQALHWMVHGNRADCLHSIISFDINSEQFHTTPHPGDRCRLIRKHTDMGLMEMERKLALCHNCSNKILDIWILEDYEHKVWIKRHVIDIEPLMGFYGINSNDGSEAYIGDIHLFNNELLMRVGNRELLLYNMESRTLQSVGKSVRISKDEDLRVLAVPHVNALSKMSLQTREKDHIHLVQALDLVFFVLIDA